MGFAGCFRRTGTDRRLVTVPVLLFMISPFLFALDLVNLSLDNTKLAREDFLYISLIIDHPFPDDIVIDEPNFPPSLQLYWGPSIRPLTIKTETGERRVTEARYKMKAVRTGWYTLDPFSVTVSGFVNRSMTTEPRTFGVGNKKGSEVILPIEVSWNPGREKVYVGEAVPLVLELSNQEVIPRILSIDVSSPNTGLFEKTSSFREISAEPFGNITLYTVPIASYMFTPTQPVRVSIPSASVETEQGSGKSSRITLEVLPLPEEAQQYSAVGNFRVTSRIEEADIQGPDVMFYIRIEGEGNLGYFKFPEPKCEGGVLVEQIEEYSFEPSAKGYKGYREQYFRFSPVSGPVMVFSIPEWTWLDPDSVIVRRIPEKEERLEVRIPEQVEENIRAGDFFLPALKSLEEVIRAKHIDHYLNIRSYLWCLPGIVLFLLILIFKKLHILFVSVLLLFLGAGGNEIDPSSHPLLQKGIESYHQEDYSEAALWFYKALEEYEIIYKSGDAILLEIK